MVSNNRIERVAIVGAGGNSGKYIAEALLKTGKHKVSAITRSDSTSALPQGLEIKKVNYDDEGSLVEALQGQDALVITMTVMAPPDTEKKLIEAAAKAKVPWIFPNVWSNDHANESLSRETLVGDKIMATLKDIKDIGQSSYVAMITGFWYEWSLSIPPAFGFDFPSRTVTFFDDGDFKITTSTWPQVGNAVAQILSLKVSAEGPNDKGPYLEQFKNKFCYTNSFTISQKDMLDSVLRVTNAKLADWTVKHEPSKERYYAALEQMKGGDRVGFAKALYTRVFFPNGGGNFEETRGLQNGILGLPKEDLDEATKRAIKRAEELGGAF
ncbi:MAG: hypothetical protein M1822_001193 [Bathelium mastoideum]|nr:MAG: hypothetical protein M1822_001193 [Bathelium mastoideum]